MQFRFQTQSKLTNLSYLNNQEDLNSLAIDYIQLQKYTFQRGQRVNIYFEYIYVYMKIFHFFIKIDF